MICIEQKQDYMDFANAVLKADFTLENSKCIASLGVSGEILGVVVFDRFTKHGCELAVASTSPRFLTKQLLDVTFHYIFVTCGKIRATAIVSEDNEKSLKMQKGIGFVEEAKLKNLYGDKDGVVFRMLKDECRWLRNK